MNEQNDDRATAMRAEIDVNNIFYAVQEEMENGQRKYTEAIEIWKEGTKRTKEFYQEALRSPETDKEYLDAIRMELIRIHKMKEEFFKKKSHRTRKQNKKNAVPLVEKTATEQFFGKEENCEYLSKKRKANKIKAKIKEDNEAKINW